MKTKQQLEEQIIDMYLNNKINSATKEAKLLFLNLFPTKEGFKHIENMLKDSQALEFMEKVVDREMDLEEQGLEISDMSEECLHSIFDSLTRKGFFRKDRKGYALTPKDNLNMDSLSDAEALVYIKFRKMFFNKIMENKEIL